MTIADVMEDATVLNERFKDDPQTYQKLGNALLNVGGGYPLPERFRALFTLKNLGTLAAVEVICRAFEDESALLKHELAYVLGQMKHIEAIGVLSKVLGDLQENSMVRHEAAEALGAIGHDSCLPTLERYLNDPEVVVRETCEIAMEKIRHAANSPEEQDKVGKMNNSMMYASIDPAPAFVSAFSVAELRDCLLDESRPLFERYRAMFSLRNEGSVEAVQALGDGLRLGKSALFRHEVAFVFGQMQHPASVGVLSQVLAIGEEADMVRHECAEALGSIATEECWPVLSGYASQDAPRVVKESCAVAIDMWEYENDPTRFHHTL